MKKILSLVLSIIGVVGYSQYEGGSGGGADSDTDLGIPIEGIVFTGNTSSDWFEPTNWNTGVVPSSSSYVQITSGVISDIEGSPDPVNVEVAGLVINDPDAELLIKPSNSLMITSTFENTGSVVLEANKDGAYAMLKFDGEYSGTGSVFHQQHFKGGWHMVSSSMVPTNAGFFGQVSADRHPNAYNFFSWNGIGYDLVANNASSIDARLGYYGFVGENNGQLVGFREVGVQSFEGVPNTSTGTLPMFNLGADTTGGSSGGGTWSFVVDGQILGGWNMVANPFTAALDFTTLNFSDNDSVEQAFYVFDPITGTGDGSFTSYSAGGINDPFIAPFQSFWVRVKDDNIVMDGLSMSANAVIPATYPDFYRPAVDKVVIRVFETNATQNKDHTVVAFVDGTTDDFDNGWDARKMPNGGNTPSVYTMGTKDALVNNAIDYGNASAGEKRSIDMGFIAPKHAANYTFNFDQNYMINSYAVYLEDKKLDHFHNLSTADYTFASDTGYVDRFVLHFRTNALGAEQEFAKKQTFRAWVYENTAYIHSHIDMGKRGVLLTDMGGRTVFHNHVELVADKREEMALPQLSAGVYLLHVEGQKPVKVVVH